ncbi:hypothetical protein F3N42_03635 [Marinihelvus fidelis]|uniref:Bacteriophage tail tape measure N-terminal domain-containing protein n=1 Tax=Marinihelvus fidelis TaxID=2613842 RepID=A0A5N0TG41_9GAMM|nr:hypothetical protein [Marinihelvus fidelis]KAA9133454.1 hypothetical protein F3N42_03635 [Marinihelvus fidelis]
MARNFKTGILITGDAKGAVNAMRLTQAEMKKLRLEQAKSNKSFGDGVRQLRGVAIGATAIVGAAAGAVGAIGGLAKMIADVGDKTHKMSLRLGVSAKFLSGMDHAASLAGTSLDTVDKGMRKMSKTIADAESGMTTYNRAFDRIGLNVEELRGLNPEQQFLKIADAIKNTEDPTLRLAAAQDIFGARQAELIPLLIQGAEALEEQMEFAERVGAVMSDKLVKASAQYKDELEKLRKVGEGVRNQFGEGLIPELVALMQHFNEGAKASDRWVTAGERVGKVARTIVSAFVVVRETAGFVGEAIVGLGASVLHSLQALAAPFTEFIRTMAAAGAALAKGEFAAAADAFDGMGERIVASAKEHSKAAVDAMGFVGESLKTRVGNVVEEVGDIMTRQAKITQDLGGEAESTAEDMEQLAKAMEKVKSAAQSHLDRLFPLLRIEREYAQAKAELQAAYDGELISAELLSEALRLLKLEYIDATLAAGGLEEITVKTARKAIPELTKKVNTMNTAIERGVERIDDLFADLWKDLIKGSSDAFDKIQDFFEDMLAEMLHAATTRNIVGAITGSFAAGTANASGGGNQAAVQQAFQIPYLNGQAPGAAGGGFSFAGFFGQQNGASWTGFNESAGGTAIGGAIGYYGGSALGNLIDNSNRLDGPDYAGIGAAAGAIIGTFIPVIGNLLGGIIGGVLGGLFGKFFGRDFEGAFGGSGASGADPEDQRFTTPLGEVVSLFGRGGFGHVDESDTFAGGVRQSIEAIDTAVAEFLDNDQLAAVQDALVGWRAEVNNPANAAEEIIGSRVDAIVGVFDEQVQRFVNQAGSIEERIERLNVGLTIERLFEALGDSLAGRSYTELAAVIEGMRQNGEDWGQVMDRFAQDFERVTAATASLEAFAGSDPLSDYAQIIADNNRTLFQSANALGDAIRDMAADFDGSAESVMALGDLTLARYHAEMQLLGQIDDVAAQVAGTFTGLNDQFDRILLGDDGFYEKLRSQANDLKDSLATMTDPAEISATVQEIQRLTGQAWGLLSAEQQAALVGEFAAFTGGVTDIAGSRLSTVRDSVVAEADELRSLIGAMTEDIVDPLALVASMHEGAAEALLNAATALEQAVSPDPVTGDPINTQPGGPGTGDDNIRPHSDPAQVAADVATASAMAMSDAVDRMGDKVAAAVANAVRGIQFNVRVNQQPDLVND